MVQSGDFISFQTMAKKSALLSASWEQAVHYILATLPTIRRRPKLGYGSRSSSSVLAALAAREVPAVQLARTRALDLADSLSDD